MAALGCRQGIIFTWMHWYSVWLLLTRMGRKWTLGSNHSVTVNKERKEGRVNSLDPLPALQSCDKRMFILLPLKALSAQQHKHCIFP